MPNNIDMGGFGSPGLPVLSRLNGAVIADADPSATTVQQWRSGGAHVLSVSKTSGRLAFSNPNGAYVSTLDPSGGAGGVGFHFFTAPSVFADLAINSGNASVVVGRGAALGFTSAAANTTNGDVILARDAAAILNLRNSTNAQTLRVSGTHTDASNYVRASLAATSTAVTLAAETAGTGADNVPVILTPAGTSQVEVGNGVQFTEMTAPSAPAANKVILFAQDNGAGKTQLMALFPSGAAQQVAIEP